VRPALLEPAAPEKPRNPRFAARLAIEQAILIRSLARAPAIGLLSVVVVHGCHFASWVQASCRSSGAHRALSLGGDGSWR
jgi:hypothetical protein